MPRPTHQERVDKAIVEHPTEKFIIPELTGRICSRGNKKVLSNREIAQFVRMSKHAVKIGTRLVQLAGGLPCQYDEYQRKVA